MKNVFVYRQSPNIELLAIDEKWLETVVDIHLEMYKDQSNFGQSLGRGFVKKTYQWFCDHSNSFGFIAFVEGNPAGFVVGSEPDQRRKLNSYRFMTGLGVLVRRPSVLLTTPVMCALRNKARKFHKNNRICHMDFSNKNSFNLYSLAVLPKYSANRISTLLLTACEKHALERDKRIIFGYVNSKNRPSMILHHLMGYNINRMRSTESSICFYKIIENDQVRA